MSFVEPLSTPLFAVREKQWEVTEVEETGNSGNAALTRLGDAVGQPPRRAAEKAKALFPFIARQAGPEGGAVVGGEEAGSAGRPPAARGR
ncbi:hypothetical protein [Streptomyces pactum]|uniref:hypothetical protein n=1 Tax=Streptomyces pactum TaxID=68249 RepID=UPI0036F83497